MATIMALILYEKNKRKIIWRIILHTFYNKLLDKIGENLVKIVAPDSPFINFRDYNILVVVKSLKENLIDSILSVARDCGAEAKTDVLLVPIVLEKDDPQLKEIEEWFNNAFI